MCDLLVFRGLPGYSGGQRPPLVIQGVRGPPWLFRGSEAPLVIQGVRGPPESIASQCIYANQNLNHFC